MSESNHINAIMNDIMKHSSQNSQAWDRMRLGKFTASKIWQLMNDPKTKADRESGKFSATGERYILERAMEEVTGISSDESFGRAIDHGNEWEEHALTKLKEALDLPMVMKPPFKLFNDHSGASPDAFVDHPEFGRVGVEIKCPFNSINHFWHSQIIDAKTLKEIDSTYYWQIMMNCLTHQISRWIFASFDPRMPEGKMLHYCYIDPSIDELTDLCERLERAINRKMEIIQNFTAPKSNQ